MKKISGNARQRAGCRDEGVLKKRINIEIITFLGSFILQAVSTNVNHLKILSENVWWAALSQRSLTKAVSPDQRQRFK